MTFRDILAAAAVLALAAPIATAQPFEQWKVTGKGWNVQTNKANDSCFAEFVTNEGIVMQLGTEPKFMQPGMERYFGRLSLYLPNQIVEEGASAPVEVELGNKRYISQAHAVQREGYGGGFFLGDDVDFASSIRNEKEMIILAPGAKITAQIGEMGMPAALRELRDCQLAAGGS